MNNTLSLTFILTQVLLVIWFSGYELDARAEWTLLPGTEDMGVNIIETDEHRLYAAASQGVYVSRDNGYTWRYSELAHGLEHFYLIAIGIGPNAMYAGTNNHGVYRSDSHGKTWKPKRKGIRIFDLDDPDREPYYAEAKQILVTRSGAVIAVGYHSGTHISHDRGETWHDTDDWDFADGIWTMTEFDGYWWSVYSSASIAALRTPDNGKTWERLPHLNYSEIADWAVLGDRLYLAGSGGFARWNEAEHGWEDLSLGLPFTNEPKKEWRRKLHIQSLALNRGRIFAGLPRSGVWMFDQQFERWIPAGLDGLTVTSLISHQSDLYAVAMDSNWDSLGIYRASIPLVNPYGKAAATWGALKSP